jgi:hypothetical protein
LIFELPGGRIQLSTNLFRLHEFGPQGLVDILTARGIELGAQQVVGLCPASAANAAATGRLLEGRLAAAAAAVAAERCKARATDEMLAMDKRLAHVAKSFAEMAPDQESLLAAGERSAALVPVLSAAKVQDDELSEMLWSAARGFRAALTTETTDRFPARLQAFDRLASPKP